MPVTFPITIPALTGRKDKPHAAVEFLSNLASISLGKTPERRSADGSVLIPSNEVTVGDVLSSPWGLRDAAIGSPEAGAELLTGGEVERPDRSKQLMSSLVPGWGAIPQSRGEAAEFIIDNLTDPLNAVGTGIGVKAMKLPSKGMKRLPKNPRRGAVILSGPQPVGPTGVEPRPFYYSRLRDAAAALPGEKFKAQSIPNLLKKHAPEGFAPEEYDWVRVPEFLKGKTEVTKADLLRHIDDNAIRIDARKMAGVPVEPTYYAPAEGVTPREFLQRYADRIDTSGLQHWDNQLIEDAEQVREALQSGDDSWVEDYYHILTGRLGRNMQHDRELAALGDYAVRKEHNRKSIVPDADGPATYERYAIPGLHSNYQELLLGLAPPMKTVRTGAALHDQRHLIPDYYEEAFPGDMPDLSGTYGARDIASEHLKNIEELPDYQEPHWYAQGAPDNIIAHLRTTERNTPQGRTLFMDESQSQAHQAGKKFGYKGDPIEPVKFRPDGKTAEGGASFYDSDAGFSLQPVNNGKQFRLFGPDSMDHGVFDSVEEATQVSEELRRTWKAYNPENERPPQLPLKQAWPSLTIKELLRKAAEGGYDRAGWSMGDDIHKVVGGGIEGQRMHYDRRLEKELQEIAKKRGWEVPVETLPLGDPRPSRKSLAHQLAEGSINEQEAVAMGLPQDIVDDLQYGSIDVTDAMEEMARRGLEMPNAKYKSPDHHSFQITPQMRKDILEKGFPLMALMPFLMGFGSSDGND